MSKKGTKKCCVCGCYDEPRYQVYDGFVCSDLCLKQRETTNENRISSHRCEVCGKSISICRIEDVYVSPDYDSFDDRDIVFLCSTDCYAYYNNILVSGTSAYSTLDNIVQKRKAAERAAPKVRKLIINPKKFSEEESEKEAKRKEADPLFRHIEATIMDLVNEENK